MTISPGTIVFVPYHQDERLGDGDIPLTEADIRVIPELPPGDVWERLAVLHEVTARTVAHARTAGITPTVVSGDCLTMLGTVAGTQRAEVDAAIVWLDAHGDVHTVESSTSGYLGGMALRLVLGDHPELIANRLGLRPVAERRAMLVDVRELDPAEVDYLASAEIGRSTVPELRADVLPDGPLILHVDLDVIDSGELPGMRFPAPDGPAASAVLDAVRRVLATGRVVAFDIACPWHPADAAETARRAAILATLTG